MSQLKQFGDGNIPEATVNAMIESAIKNEREAVLKETAINNYKQVCKTAGLEIKSEDLERLSNTSVLANDIIRETTSIKNIFDKYNKTSIGVSSEPTYTGKGKEDKKSPKDYQEQSGWTVGTPSMWEKKE